MRLLLQRGADAEIKVRHLSPQADIGKYPDVAHGQDEDEFTAQELAKIAGHAEIANLLSHTQNAPT